MMGVKNSQWCAADGSKTGDPYKNTTGGDPALPLRQACGQPARKPPIPIRIQRAEEHLGLSCNTLWTKEHTGAGEMAQSVKSLVYKHKDLSLSSQHPHKKSSVALVILIVGWRQMDLSSSLPAMLAELLNTRSAGDTGSWGTIPEVDLWLQHGCSFTHT